LTGLLIILIISISSEGDGVLVKCITVGAGSDGESWTVTDMDRLDPRVSASKVEGFVVSDRVSVLNRHAW